MWNFYVYQSLIMGWGHLCGFPTLHMNIMTFFSSTYKYFQLYKCL